MIEKVEVVRTNLSKQDNQKIGCRDSKNVDQGQLSKETKVTKVILKFINIIIRS